MEGSFLASSFQPPAAADDSSRYPSWVLLDKRAYFAHRVNATTRTVKTSTGHEVEITFCLADPPAVSYFCVHCPNLDREDYTLEPRVASSAADLVLLCFAFRAGPRNTDVDSDLIEFFVCKPTGSIEPVPYSPTGTRHSWHASIVPLNGGNFIVADLSTTAEQYQYELHVFSSETGEWSTTPLQLPTPAHVLPRNMPTQIDKVISLGGTLVGWVDLWRGILFCDVLEKEPVLGFIPLPKAAFDLRRIHQPQPVRDVAFCRNGFINFVEIEHFRRKLNIVNRRSYKTTAHLDTQDVIHDKEFLMHDDLDRDLDDKPVFVPDGWKIRTMFKRVEWDYWRKKHTVHVDDISAVPEEHTVPLLPQLWDDRDMKWTLRNLETTGFPCFGVYGDNVVYLMSKVEPDGKESWVVGVDLEKKQLHVVKPYCAARCEPTLIPCEFSEYLNTNPRPYSAANRPQNGVPNDLASCTAQNYVPNNVQPQQNTWNVNGYYGSWNGSGYGTYPAGYGNYLHPTPLQPQYVLPPNFSQTVQPMPIRSGYVYADWTDPDVHGRIWMTVSSNDISRLSAAPLAPSTPPMPPFAQPLDPSQTFTGPMTSTVGSYDVLSHGQQHNVKPFSYWTQGGEEDYYGWELGDEDYNG